MILEIPLLMPPLRILETPSVMVLVRILETPSVLMKLLRILEIRSVW
jgi:hypothetical protein